MRNSILAAAAALLIAAAPMSYAAANQAFTDVPAGHWAYESLNRLAENGILKGYPDGSFKGDKLVTRYALSLIVANMLSNIEAIGKDQVSEADLLEVEKLTMEFAEELSSMGVKIKNIDEDLKNVKEDLTYLKADVKDIKDYFENSAEKVKLSGDMLIRNYDYGMDKTKSADEHRTETVLRLQFDARVDDNVFVRARWNVLGNNSNVNGQQWRGNHWVGDNKETGDVEIAYVKITDAFNEAATFKLGRDFYTHGHGLVVHDFMDAVHYDVMAGEVNIAANVFFNRDKYGHDYHNIWNINFDYQYEDSQSFYLGFYYNTYDGVDKKPRLVEEPREVAIDPINNIPNVTDASRTIVELGAKGNIDGDGNYKYDVGGVYSKIDYERIREDGEKVSSTEDGWMTYVAVEYDNKRDWNVKASYAYANEESAANISRRDDNAWCMEEETPFEDILWYQIDGHNTYLNMMRMYNIQDVKFQIRYRPVNADKHSFRLAYDYVSDINDHCGEPKDAYNTIGYDDLKFSMLTFEYNYQLAENTRLRLGYAKVFEDSIITRENLVEGIAKKKAKDQDIFYTEIYSKF